MSRQTTIRIMNSDNGCFVVRWGEGRKQKSELVKTYSEAEALALRLYSAAGGKGKAEVFDYTGTPPGKVLRLFDDEGDAY